MRARLVATVLAALLLIPPAVAAAPSIGPGLVTGPEAQAAFETLARDGAVTFTDFESVPTGPHLKLKLDGPAKGITAKLRTTQFRYPLPPKRAPKDTPVLVLPYGFVSAPANHRLMGSNPGDAPDGQAKYKLVLSTPVGYAGLLRMWNTYSLTRFYNKAGTLLAEHRNTENHEFVGYVAAGPGDRVKTIEFDGVPEQPGDKQNRVFQVGEVDDLYLGYGFAQAKSAGEEDPPPLDELVVDDTGEAWAPSGSGSNQWRLKDLKVPNFASAALIMTLIIVGRTPVTPVVAGVVLYRLLLGL